MAAWSWPGTLYSSAGTKEVVIIFSYRTRAIILPSVMNLDIMNHLERNLGVIHRLIGLAYLVHRKFSIHHSNVLHSLVNHEVLGWWRVV